MRSLTPTLTLTGAAMLLATLTACGDYASPAAEAGPSLAAEHVYDSGQFTETIPSPCNGESIEFSGTAVGHITTIDDRHSEFWTSALGTGVGPVSGATYTYRYDSGHENFNSNGLQNTFAGGTNARIISDQPALSFTVRFVFHAITLPSGEFKVTTNADHGGCNG